MPKTINTSRVPSLVPAGPLEASLGRLFHDRRKAARPKVSLAQLAAHLKCSINTIRWHEAGTRLMRLDDVVRAAAFMDVPHADLLPPQVDEPAPAPPVPRRPKPKEGRKPLRADVVSRKMLKAE